MLKRTTFVACLMLAATIASAQETYKLERKFTPGTYWVTNYSSINQTMKMPGQNVKQSISQMMVAKMTVSKPDADGNRKAAISYERIVQKMEMNDGMMRMNYDSDDGDNPSPMASMMEPLTDVTFTMTITKNNEIKDFKGMEEMIRKMAKGNPQIAQAVGQLKENFGKAQVQQMIGHGTMGLPEKPVAVGDTWTDAIDLAMPMVGEMEVEMVSKLAGVRKKNGREIAKIEYTADGDLNDAEKPAQQQPMEFTKMKIKQAGRTFFDIASGRAVRSEMQQQSHMIAKAAQGMNMNIQQAMSTVVLQTAERNTKAEEQFAKTGKLP